MSNQTMHSKIQRAIPVHGRNTVRMYCALSLCALTMMGMIGCNDPKAASARNFEAAIDTILQKQNPACLQLGVQLPCTIQTDSTFGNATQELEALVKVGLMAKQATTTQRYDYQTRTNMPQPAVQYDLTAAGRKLMTKSNYIFGGSGLKWGEATVSEIENFADAGFGTMKMAQVKYKYHIQHVENWAKDPGVQAAFPALAKAVQSADTPQEAQTTLMQTANGWTDKL